MNLIIYQNPHHFLFIPVSLKKSLFLLELDIDAVFCGILVGNRLDRCDLGVLLLWLEEVAEPLLGLEVLLDRLSYFLLCRCYRAVNRVDNETIYSSDNIRKGRNKVKRGIW